MIIVKVIVIVVVVVVVVAVVTVVIVVVHPRRAARAPLQAEIVGAVRQAHPELPNNTK